MGIEQLQLVMNALREARAFSLATELDWYDRLERIDGPVMAAIGQGTGGGEGGDAGGGTGTDRGGGEGAGDEGGEDTGGEGGAGGTPNISEMFAGFRDEVMERFGDLERGLPVVDDGDDDDDEGGAAGGAPLTGIFDASNFTLDDYDDDGHLKPEAQGRALSEAVNRAVAQAVAPEREKAAAERRDAQADQLQEKYAVFGDPVARKPIIDMAKGMAKNLADATGNSDLASTLWREPSFLEVVYLGTVGRRAAESETPAGGDGDGVTLESGGSAGPAASGDDADGKETAQRIVSLAKKSKFRLGS